MARDTTIGPAPWERPTSTRFAQTAARTAKASTNRHSAPTNPKALTPAEQAKANLPLTTIGDLLAEPDVVVDWLVRDRIPSASTCLLAGKPKCGKTTAARHLALAVARGETWLDGACAAGSVWYLGFEGRPQDHKSHFRRMGATPTDRIWLYVGQAKKTVVADVRLRAQQERPTLIIVDTLQRFIKASSLDDYAEVTTLFDLVLEIARSSGAALLLLHHAGKADRAGLDTILGSTAIGGSCDQVFMIVRTARVRTIQSIQRVGDDLEERVLELDERTGRVRLGPTRDAYERHLMAQNLYDALDRANTGLTQTAWFELVEGRRTVKLVALRQLLVPETGPALVTRFGKGTRNDPYRYTVVADSVSSSLVPYRTGNQNLFSSSSDSFPKESTSVSSSQVPAQDAIAGNHLSGSGNHHSTPGRRRPE
jgi:hypothetical protein